MVGLDIGSKTIKIVEIEKKGPGFSLLSAGIVAYSGKALGELTDDKEISSLGQIIRKLHKDSRISSKEVVISLPEPLVFTRTIKFPLLTDTEIASAVKWEAEQYIPIPVKEAIIQHAILERRETATPPEVIVLLVAAPKAVVEKYVKVVSAAGLTAVVVETELIALTRCLAPNDKTVLLVDLGATSTDIAIAKKGFLNFSRSIPTAGEAFTRAVAQTLGVEASQAEEYKKSYGLSEKELEGKIRGAIDPVFRKVVDEIKKAIHFYQAEEKEEAPTLVIVVGGTSAMPQVVPLLTKFLGLEVLVGNPFAKVFLDPVTSRKLAPYAHFYSVAVGLSLREK